MIKTPKADSRGFALEVVRKLRAAGFEALWAGGCVRDLLLGAKPKDFDVATNAKPEVVRKLFRRTVAVGQAFGVVKVLGDSGTEVEVATFRIDAEYTDGRRPDGVVFSTAEEDAQRRDLTINGIFFDPVADEYVDYVGGQADLQAKIIRAIGDPKARFQEDKLRLLRAIRFAARLDFDIDPATAAALRELAPQLHVVSAERILMEIRLMFEAPMRAKALALLADHGLLFKAIPELAIKETSDDALAAGLQAVAALPEQEIALSVAVSALFSQLEVDRSVRFFERLKAANAERDLAAWLAKHRSDLDAARTLPMHALKRLFAHPHIDDLLTLHRAIAVATTEPARSERLAANAWARDLFESMAAEEINPMPLLTGDALIAHGYTPSPAFKGVLESVRNQQLDGIVKTQQQALQVGTELLNEMDGPIRR